LKIDKNFTELLKKQNEQLKTENQELEKRKEVEQQRLIDSREKYVIG